MPPMTPFPTDAWATPAARAGQGFGVGFGGNGFSYSYSSAFPSAAPLAQEFAYMFEPQSDAQERLREQAERAREMVERNREQIDRAREMADRNADMYLSGKRAIDNGEYERAIKNFDRVIELKTNNVEGAYYFKAYCLHKLGKRDEALAALAELSKQFPQSKWLNDGKALQMEIGQPPADGGGEEYQLLALASLMNADPERAVPLVDKLITDPKKTVQFKRRALFILAGAQKRSEKARELVGKYAKGAPNPDIQYAAVTYLGQDRTKENQKTLTEVYASSSDPAIKRAVIRGLGDSRDCEHLLALAKSESNPDLRRDAIRYLGNAQCSAELSQIYASEANAELKESILRALMSSQSTDRLIEVAKNEKDLKLRSSAIRYLGGIRKEKSGDALASLYASETDKNLKHELLRSLANQNSAKQLVDISRAEKDPELKMQAVKYLSNMRGSKEATDYMMELLNK
jgi:HEAT repeat protein